MNKKIKAKDFQKYLGEILLVGGGFITTYNLLNFRHSYYGSHEEGLLPSLKIWSDGMGDPTVYYYYDNESLFLLSMGVALIIIGILIIRNKNK